MTEKKTPFFEKFANSVSRATGSSTAFIIALALIIVWALSGPVFHYSENWQLIINTGTTIITFLMVFLIQKAQNKESKALHLKLNELISATKGASNRLVNIEDMDEKELDELHQLYIKLADLALSTRNLKISKSIETEINHLGEKMESIEDKVEEIDDKMDELSKKQQS